MEHQANDQIGAWRIVRILGKGGMGTVYEVEDAAGAHFALKLFTGGAKNRAFLARRFRAEAKLLAALDHPYLVKVRDVGVDEATGNPWFAMDLVLDADGKPETLENVRQRGGISHEQALRWFHELSDVLTYLHARGVVHRDVKLENVLIDAEGHAILSDFGVSRIFDDGLREQLDITTTFIEGQTTGTRPVMGTYFYLAPEVRAGRAATAAADWYALGVLFFRLLTGMWYEPPAAQTEKGERRRTSPFDLLLMFDSFWQTNLPRLLSDDQKTRTVVVGVGAARKRRRTWAALCGLAVLVGGILAAWLGRDTLLRVRNRPAPPPGVVWMENPESIRGVDIGTVTSLVVKSSAGRIAPNQFKRWPNLRHVRVEEGAREIGVAAFFGCSNLETVTLPDSLKHLEGYAFGDCFTLREVRFGKGLLDVGQAAFGGCSNLLHVYFGGDAPAPRGTRIYVRTPTNLVNHVNAAAKGWTEYWPPNDDFARSVHPTHHARGTKHQARP